MVEHGKVGTILLKCCTSDSEEAVLAAIGSAAAQFLESTMKSGEVIGISSWSASLLSTVNQMHPIRKVEKCLVVQMLGGIGSPSAEQHANRLAVRLATLVRGEAHFLPIPGIVGSTRAAKVLLQDPNVSSTLAGHRPTHRAAFGQSATGQCHCRLISWLSDPPS
jgi:DNA-binding transcriptional regulator LsrR (DeoR family)